MSYQSGAKAFAHCSLAGFFWKRNREHPLLVLSDMIVGVACAVVNLYAGKENFLGISTEAIPSTKGVSA